MLLDASTPPVCFVLCVFLSLYFFVFLGSVKIFMLPHPKCHTCSWEDDNFGKYFNFLIHHTLPGAIAYSSTNKYSIILICADVLKDILGIDLDLDSPPECFLQTDVDEDDGTETSVDDEFELDLNKVDRELQGNRISVASSSSRDSTFSSNSLTSNLSVPCGSSGVESDLGEDATHEDTEEGQDRQPKPRKKPKKKSKSLLGLERFSLLFKTPRSPRAESVGYNGDTSKDFIRTGGKLKHSRLLVRQVCPPALDLFSLEKQVCFRRRPILSIDEGNVEEVPTLVKVVVFGGDREAGRLARAYSDLQQKESKCPQLTRTCKLHFYFVPTKRRNGGKRGGLASTEGQVGGLTKTAANVVKLSTFCH